MASRGITGQATVALGPGWKAFNARRVCMVTEQGRKRGPGTQIRGLRVGRALWDSGQEEQLGPEVGTGKRKEAREEGTG